jgi:hypothetical protein
MEIHMLKLYEVKVWRSAEPRDFDTVWVRTHTARRAQELAMEGYPGCDAHTERMLVDGAWQCAVSDD